MPKGRKNPDPPNPGQHNVEPRRVAPSFEPLSGLRVTIRCRPKGLQKPWQLVGKVTSFADLRFAKTDYSGVDVGDSMFDTLTVESGGFSFVAM